MTLLPLPIGPNKRISPERKAVTVCPGQSKNAVSVFPGPQASRYAVVTFFVRSPR